MNASKVNQTPVSSQQVGSELRDAISEFVFFEAQLLDEGRFDEWLTLVDERIRYFMPVRVTLLRGEGSELSDGGHIDDLYPALTARVHRMTSRYNWAENPSSRTRHHVSNLRIRSIESATSDEQRFSVLTNLLFFRSRVDEARHDLISCERQDVLVQRGGEFKLLERRIVLDHTVIGTHNLAFLL